MTHKGSITLETERLILRRFVLSDADAIYNNWASDPVVTKFLRWPTHQSIEVTKYVLAEWVNNNDSEFYQWAIVPKDVGIPIGTIGSVGLINDISSIQIGYCIGKSWWHQGYTSEALSEVIRFFIEEVGANRIESQHDPRNENSGKVMSKCGMKYEGTLRQSDISNLGVVDAVHCAILAEDWRAMKNNSILGIPNSILAHFGAKTHHATLPILDTALAKNYKNVVLIIFDGMGSDMLSANVPDGFLLKNKAADISSVYPCTTTAALTTFESGLTPAEHGWLGWSCYFNEIDKCVDLFSGHHSGTENPAVAYNIVWDKLSYANVLDQIRKANPSVECCGVSPFAEYKAYTCEEVCANITALCAKPGRRYIYAYHDQPDHDMHDFGCYDARVRDMVRSFDKQIEQLATQLSDTLLIVTADHGLTNVKMLCAEDYPEIWECLAAPPSREPRSLSFFVKDEYKGVFPERFKAHFGKDFTFMTGEQALECGIFGEGNLHPKTRDFVGDYVALATGNIGLWYRDNKGEHNDFAAAHAGLRPEEMTIPLILIKR